MQSEMDLIYTNETWELVALPVNKKPLAYNGLPKQIYIRIRPPVIESSASCERLQARRKRQLQQGILTSGEVDDPPIYA